MQIIDNVQLDFCDVLIQPKRSTINSRKEVDIYRTFKFGKDLQKSFTAIPIMAANMGTTGTPKMAEALSKLSYMCALEKHTSLADLQALLEKLQRGATVDGKPVCTYAQRVFPTIGINDSFDTVLALSKNFLISGFVIDIANGYMMKLIEKVKEARKLFPEMFIIVGNVVTADMTTDLILAGADCVKIGIGSGSSCLTRMKTGVGRPQLSTIIECADAAHQLHAYVMSDGGAVIPGDICKAFCAGADFIMSGSIFAGCDEAEGELVARQYLTDELDDNFKPVAAEKKFKQYYGMSSKYAQEKHFGKFNSYRSSEGRTKLIPSTGPLAGVVEDINGSIRSCCSYIGSHKLKHMPKHATFYKVNRQLNEVFANCKDFT